MKTINNDRLNAFENSGRNNLTASPESSAFSDFGFRRFTAECSQKLAALKDRLAADLANQFGTLNARLVRQVVSEADSLNYIFGYTICWDISQRDPWGKGMHNTRNIRKGFDTFSALGPWIVTRDEIDEPQNLSIKVLQNGKEAMTAHTSDMICGLREHIRFLSSNLTLRTGDLITTGTPAGVSKLHDGDRLHGTIEKIGSMELFVKDEK